MTDDKTTQPDRDRDDERFAADAPAFGASDLGAETPGAESSGAETPVDVTWDALSAEHADDASNAEPEGRTDVVEPIGTGAGIGHEPTDAAPAATTDAPPQYGVGPLSIREVSILGVWALSFIFSFFPIYGRFGAGSSVWTAGIDWVLTIGVPTAAVFLLLLRRYSPQGIRRVGSLGIDQFASVAFSVAALVWLGIIWGAFVALAQTRVFVASWVVWVELILMLAGVVLTVAAPHLPVLGEDFRHRPDAPAHRLARPTRPVVARPASARPSHVGAATATPAGWSHDGSDAHHAAPADAAEPFAASDDTTQLPEAAPAQQAFWALAPEERDVLDETGAPLFRVGPTAWALVIEDRGGVFVVRNEDGRIGYLHETTDVVRG